MLFVCVDEVGRDITSTIKQEMLNYSNQLTYSTLQDGKDGREKNGIGSKHVSEHFIGFDIFF